MSTEQTPTTAPVDAAVMRAMEIVNAVEWSGDMTRIIRAGRFLAKRLGELHAFIEELPCECHDEYGKPLGVACERCQVLGRDGRYA